MFTLDGTISLAFRFFYNGEEIALRDSPLAEEEVWVKIEVSEAANGGTRKLIENHTRLEMGLML